MTTGNDGSVKVLLIAGVGRSGSTLLERLLAAHPDVETVGEVAEVWRWGPLADELCGCGIPFHACPFWTEVGSRLGGWDHAESAQARREGLDRLRYLPGLYAPGMASRAFRDRLRDHLLLLRDLYLAISDVAGREVIVDASKRPGHLLLLRAIPQLDVRVVHLVRDPRGVAYSWTKRVPRAHIRTMDPELPVAHPAWTALEWDAVNLAVEGSSRDVPSIRLRYEDLAAQPAEVLPAAFAVAGLDPPDALLEALRAGSPVEIPTTHAIAGNPARSEGATIAVRPDREWYGALPAEHQLAVSALTAPLLARYGYPLRIRDASS